jgi:hypothetical protein
VAGEKAKEKIKGTVPFIMNKPNAWVIHESASFMNNSGA